MSFCPVCGSELKPEATTCPVCGTSVAVQPQPPVNTHPQKKAKKKKKNLGIKITAAVLAVIILAVSGLFIADNIMYKNEIEAEEYITDFPVLKTETDFVVFDEEDFPSTDYSIKVERVLYGGILKSELFKQTKIIIDDTSTDPVYHIDFEKDGEYIITLEDNTDEDENTTQVDNETDSDDDKDKDAPSKVVIKVTVDDDDDEAIGSVDLDSKPGDGPVELPSEDDEDNDGIDIESDIPDDAYENNGHYYKVFDDALTWSEANELCRNSGGHLATITSEEENNFVTSLLEDKNCYWIGGFKENGEWKWVTGEDFAYSNWTYGEPNDEAGDENCIHLFGQPWESSRGKKYVGEWNDASDNGANYSNDFYSKENFGYVCEWDDEHAINDNHDIVDDEPDSTDDDQTTPADWVYVYQEFLLDGNFQLTYDTIEGRSFSLCYIDNDDIPELIVGITPEYAPHAAGAAVYTYHDGEVVFVCSGGGYGEINYVERENLICSMYTGMGITTIQTYEIANGTGVCIWTGFNDAAGIPEDQEPTYESNGVKVSLEEFKEALDIYCPYDRLSSSSDNCYPLTEHYINNYVTE